ncbi:Alpha/beta hydrolase-3 [Heracleum sosnowskyi]|uniref:Alpha/beta hydrolase-3 n=1 Tax=Heracleum sosnowskyi TaxID=360622 RepID=A0AAD8J820_9APIA|nr:Alpha/beta hydrolase-3 [Heracleum sosnowskyi]
MPDSPSPVPANRNPIVSNPDGTYTRLLELPSIAATPDDDGHSSVLSKDILINPENGTWFRIFIPRQVLNSTQKLPVLVYYHGGGFVFMSAASTTNHYFCAKIASQLHVMVASIEYRLAPEHRLPAAYDDAIEALHCIKISQDIWLRQYADLCNCFLGGSSAGGNIAYHAGLRAAEIVDDLEPLKIKGLILQQPFFSGVERTESELRLGSGSILTLAGSDRMWNMSLPVDVDRDHEYCNPLVSGGSINIELIRVLGWRVLTCGVYGDHLIDKQMELHRMLEEKGVQTVLYLGEGYHGMEIMEPSKADGLIEALKQFVSSTVSSDSNCLL